MTRPHISTEDVLGLLNAQSRSQLTEEDCHEYFSSFEKDRNRVDHLVSLMEQCKFFAADNEKRAEEYRQAADLWESRLSSLQRYGIRLLNETKMRSLESEDYVLGLDQELPTVKSSVTRNYQTDCMIPDELIFNIPEQYRQVKIIWELKKDLVREHLWAGKKLNFAKLIDKQRLRILNKSEVNYESGNDTV